MEIVYWVILTIAALIILNNLYLTVYCRVEERVDKIRKKWKTERESVLGDAGNFEKPPREETPEKEGRVKKLAKLYSKLDHYLYGWMMYCSIFTSYLPGNRIRKFFYRYVFGMKITRKTVIYGKSKIQSPWNIHADNCVVGAQCILDGRQGITIADNVVLGGGVHIWTEEHDLNDPWFGVLGDHALPVVIDERAWICSDSSILPGVHVGEGAVLATRAVAAKDCEPYGIYGGVPAKKIGERSRDLRYKLNGKPHWHFY